MKNFLIVSFIACAYACAPAGACAQSITLPQEVRGVYGAWIVIKPTQVDGGKPKYRAEYPLQIINLADFFPGQADTNNVIVQYVGVDAKGAPILNARCRLEAWNAKGDVPSDIATTSILIGNIPPGPIPPGPIPPGPIPPTPQPTDVAPIPAPGLHVIIIYETEAGGLPAKQSEILSSPQIITYLNTKCTKDGLIPGWRAWDDDFVDAQMGNLAEFWKVGYKATKAKQPANNKPMICISDGTKNVGEIVELPADAPTALELLKKYGENLSLAP